MEAMEAANVTHLQSAQHATLSACALLYGSRICNDLLHLCLAQRGIIDTSISVDTDVDATARSTTTTCTTTATSRTRITRSSSEWCVSFLFCQHAAQQVTSRFPSCCVSVLQPWSFVSLFAVNTCIGALDLTSHRMTGLAVPLKSAHRVLHHTCSSRDVFAELMILCSSGLTSLLPSIA